MAVKFETKLFFQGISHQGKETLKNIGHKSLRVVKKIQQIISILIQFFKTEVHLARCTWRSIKRLLLGTGGDYFHPTNKKVLTVFIHGFLHNETAFKDYDRHFKPKSSILRVNISNSLQDIEKSAREVKRKIKDCYTLYNQTIEINLVAHSMGGLVAACLAENYQSKKFTVKNVVALGSPFEGTEVAHTFGFVKSIQQMRPDSEFLSQLVTQMKNNQRVKYYFAGAIKDPLITPRTSSFPFGEDYPHQKKIEGKGHLCLLFSQEVKYWVIGCLGILDTLPCL